MGTSSRKIFAAFDLTTLARDRAATGRRYLEFLRSDALSAGLYELPAGGTDPQKPHGEDEVYVVTGGRARFRIGDEDVPVGVGSVLYVAAGAEHRFHSIEEDLQVLVIFAPPETDDG